MRHAKLASLVALTTLALTGCPEEEDGDTGAMTLPVSDTADTEDDGEETESPETTDDPTSGSASMTGESMSTTDPGTTTGEPETTTDGACTPADECMTAADCPNPTTDMCIGCLCVGDAPPTSSDYGPCDMCAPGEMPVAIEGIEGCFCSPGCDGAMSMCPTPNEGMGTAACALGTDPMMPTQCALLCPFGMEGFCPTGATCQDTGMMDPMGTPIGICTHPAG